MSIAASQLSDMIAALDQEVAPPQPVESKVSGTERVLKRFLGRELGLPPFVKPAPDHYARFLLHRDPADRFSVVAMVWGPGQCTAIHDHDGVWCVEGVYQGELAITQFDMKPLAGEDLEMTAQTTVSAGPRAVGNLIPPFEHHCISNPHDTAAISIHVYGRELQHCRRFVPTGRGTFKAEIVPLCYDAEVIREC